MRAALPHLKNIGVSEMANGRVILICGKICCGKTTYCEKLKATENAVVLSVDKLVLPLFGEHLGERHDEITQKAQAYLLARTAELLPLGVNVILDWGFWSAESRRTVREFFAERGFNTELHYIELTDSEWRRRIDKRNSTPNSEAYFVDSAIIEKCEGIFQPPDDSEIDVKITCK